MTAIADANILYAVGKNKNACKINKWSCNICNDEACTYNGCNMTQEWGYHGLNYITGDNDRCEDEYFLNWGIHCEQ